MIISGKIEGEFDSLAGIFTKFKESNVFDPQIFTEISMGMSSDYMLATKCGSTIIRVGSAIFGNR